jgi:UDP-N-acetylmuramate dehydrogenase
MSRLDELRAAISLEVRAEEPLAPHTTFKIGGPAEYFFEAKSADEAVRAVRVACGSGLQYFVFGGGSNMLVSDAGVRGLVIKLANRDFRIEGDTITAEAGAPTGLVSMRAAEAGLTGFEWAVGVPGTIGGAVRGNAGAYGGEMKDCVVEVCALLDGQERTLTAGECGFGYRESVFKRTPGMIVLSAALRLKPAADAVATKARLKQILLDRKEKQPVEFPTAGCMFKNWQPATEQEVELLRKTLDLDKDEAVPRTPTGGVPAGWIIDRAQLKGFAVGRVRVSEKHGNFFVATGQASADEVVQLTAAIKTKVRNITDGVIGLQEEVEYVGF